MARVANFFYTGKQFKTVEAFAAHLAQHEAPLWSDGRSSMRYKPKGITLHHTVKPTVAQWAGAKSIEALARFYRTPRAGDQTGVGWDRGPHLFIAPDGIWELTPLNMQGIHAGACNAYRFGIEHVGNYDSALWPEHIHELSIGVQAHLAVWCGFGTSDIVGHQDCLRNKTCPGTAVERHLPIIRGEVGTKIAEIHAGKTHKAFMALIEA